ncbi:MAG: bifunctional adenosylcobinamide kinase/adenosylcobinamide-phosphate guanylyltransferase, partial [Pseudomonadota bacterium]
RETDGGAPRLVDCLTIWLSNLILGGEDWRQAGERLADALASQSAPVIFVTNEVGSGIVPENKLAREYRDAAGWLNQTMAAACEEVWLCVSGYPVRMKPNDHAF